jgi:NAD(P) transhydrogenase
MSAGFKAAQAAMMLAQAADVDVIITTALIPGRAAPVLVTGEMLAAMKPGSVIVDLAAANGGNVEASVADEVVTTPGGVTIVGYTDLPSRLPRTSSTLFSNNVANLLLSVGPTTTKDKGYFHLDTADEVVMNMMLVENGRDRTDDIVPYEAPPPPPRREEVELTEEEVRVARNDKSREDFLSKAVFGPPPPPPPPPSSSPPLTPPPPATAAWPPPC